MKGMYRRCCLCCDYFVRWRVITKTLAMRQRDAVNDSADPLHMMRPSFRCRSLAGLPSLVKIALGAFHFFLMLVAGTNCARSDGSLTSELPLGCDADVLQC